MIFYCWPTVVIYGLSQLNSVDDKAGPSNKLKKFFSHLRSMGFGIVFLKNNSFLHSRPSITGLEKRPIQIGVFFLLFFPTSYEEKNREKNSLFLIT